MNSFHITEAADKGYFISCLDRPNINNIGNDNIYYLLVKLDSAGNIQWKKRINDGYHISFPGAVVQKDSNSYLVTWSEAWLEEYGGTWVVGNRVGLDSSSVWVGEIDLQGNLNGKKSLYKTAINCDTVTASDSYYSNNFIKLSDGNYLICSDHFMNTATYIKLTPSGEVIWNRKIHLLQEQIPGGLLSYTNIKYTVEASDGGILGVGEYYSDPSPLFPNGIRTSVLIKLDQYGCFEPDCHLEGCTDVEALNYNPDAVYDCGCIYKKCNETNKLEIKLRHFTDLRLLDFEIYKEGESEPLMELDGNDIGNSQRLYSEAICFENDCDANYYLDIHYNRTMPQNINYPFATKNNQQLGYFAYLHMYINDSLVLNVGNEVYASKDTTIYFSFCTPDTAKQIVDFSIYPNPTKGNLTIEIPTEIDLSMPLIFKVIDLLGREVKHCQIENNKTSFNTQNWATGVYTGMLIQNKKIIHTQKIIKL